MIILNARDINQVESFQVITANLHDGTDMMILSGVAKPNLTIDDDEEIIRDEVRVKFGIKAANLLQYTTNLGLASFNNDDSFFLFAVDSSELFVNLETRELELSAKIAVSGDDSAINRFSFQVVCIVKSTTTKVKGKIVWRKDTLQVNQPYNSFQVYAGKTIRENRDGLWYDVVEPIVYGTVIPKSHVISATEESVEYEIDNIQVSSDLIIDIMILNTVKHVGLSKVKNFGTSNTIKAGVNAALIGDVNFLISKEVIK